MELTQKPTLVRAALIALLATICLAGPLRAEGLDNDKVIDTIVGTAVQEEEVRTATDAGKIIAAIDKTRDSIDKVRKTSALDKVDIVFLADAAEAEGGPTPEIVAKVEEREADIAELRKELEGNAMLFHAIDSRRILIRDILAVDFDGSNGVIIYAAAKRGG